MNNASKTFKGVVHGNAIELEGNTGLTEGQEVTVIVRTEKSASIHSGEGILRSAGGWSDDPEGLDDYLQWTSKQRKDERRGA